MESEPQAAEGVYASAVTELPTPSSTSETAVLSPAEGISSGLPAGLTARPEVRPLRSGEEVPPLRQGGGGSAAGSAGAGGGGD